MFEEKDITTTTPGGGDDLTKISGLGPAQVDRLTAAGIRTYLDIAGRPARELAEISELPPDRVANWPSQARELAAATSGGIADRAGTAGGTAATGSPTAGSTTAGGTTADGPAATDGPGQHYESFVWRLLLDEDGTIRHTSVQHVQTGEVKRWAWWNRDALLDFVESRAVAGVGRSRPPGEQDVPEPPRTDGRHADSGPRTGSLPGSTVKPPGSTGRPPVAARPETASRLPTTRPGVSPARFFGMATGNLDIDPTDVLPLRPLTVTLTLDLAALTPRTDRFAYDATIVARRFCDEARTLVARASGMLDAARPTILLTGDGLAAGIYRLEGAVVLRAPGGAQSAMAMIEGVLLEVPQAG